MVFVQQFVNLQFALFLPSLPMWKVQDISVSQILREINNGESRSYNTALFVILGALNFVNFVNLTLQIVPKFRNPYLRKCVKMTDFKSLDWLKLISRKI